METTKELTAKAKDRIRVPATQIRRPEDGGFLSVIRAAAADPRCDVAKMQALLGMQKEVAAEEARLSFIGDKLALTDKLPVINKDGKIEFKDKGAGKATLRFASFENINDIIKPLLREFGFDLWFSSEPGVAGMVNVIGHLEHRQGFVRTTTFPMPHDASGGKSGAQGWASAFSFGKRVTTIGLLNLQTRATEDRDRDGSDGKFVQAKSGGMTEIAEDNPVSKAEAAEIRNAIEHAGISEVNFCTHYGLAKLEELPSSLFAAAKKAIADHAAKRK